MPTPCAPPNSARCDLTTELVKEFTELQGVVGGLYARAQGETEAVWQAIYDHYKPVSMEDAIPRHRTGADRGAGRQARHAARLLRRRADSHRIEGSLRAAPRRAGRGQDPGRRQAASCRCAICSADDAQLQSFFARARPLLLPGNPRLRVRRSQRRAGRRLGATWWTSKRASTRVRAVRATPISNRWPPVSNASRTSCDRPKAQASPPRRRRSTKRCSKRARNANSTQEFRRIAGQPIENVISRLRPKVDLFFDKVLVNAPDAAVRQNRLTLLHTLLAEFSTIADFSEIVTNS